MVIATVPHVCKVNICSDNGLVPWGKNAITWANVDQDVIHHMVSQERPQEISENITILLICQQ